MQGGIRLILGLALLFAGTFLSSVAPVLAELLLWVGFGLIIWGALAVFQEKKVRNLRSVESAYRSTFQRDRAAAQAVNSPPRPPSS
jgi:hypothetical protein